MYRIIHLNFGIKDSIAELINEGYIPIGRQFREFNREYQTVVHETVFNNFSKEEEHLSEKYKTISQANEFYLEEEVNKSIEAGYIPMGRMFLDGNRYVQTLTHRTVFKNVKNLITKSVFEGRER